MTAYIDLTDEALRDEVKSQLSTEDYEIGLIGVETYLNLVDAYVSALVLHTYVPAASVVALLSQTLDSLEAFLGVDDEQAVAAHAGAIEDLIDSVAPLDAPGLIERIKVARERWDATTSLLLGGAEE